MLNAIFFNTPIENIYLGHQMAEIYKDKIYAPYLQDRKDLTILDIGANIGITSYYFSQFAKTVHSFEPAKEHFEVLCNMLAFNQIKNVIPHNIAISNTNGEFNFYHVENKTMHSLRPLIIDPKEQVEMVKTIRLDTFFKAQKIEHVDFMKIDVEGSEADIICADGFQNIAGKIDAIVMETHSWMGRHPNQIKEGLKTAGFSIDRIPNEAEILVATRIKKQ